MRFLSPAYVGKWSHRFKQLTMDVDLQFSFRGPGLWQLPEWHLCSWGQELCGLAAGSSTRWLWAALVMTCRVMTCRMLLPQSGTDWSGLLLSVNGHRFQPLILQQAKSGWLYLCPAARISLVSANFSHPILICCCMSARALQEGGREDIFPYDCCWHLQNKSEVRQLFVGGFGACSSSEPVGIAQCLSPSRDLPSCSMGKIAQVVLLLNFVF